VNAVLREITNMSAMRDRSVLFEKAGLVPPC